jgi:hypothetical protein
MNPDLFKPLLGRVATGAALTPDEATQTCAVKRLKRSLPPRKCCGATACG